MYRQDFFYNNEQDAYRMDAEARVMRKMVGDKKLPFGILSKMGIEYQDVERNPNKLVTNEEINKLDMKYNPNDNTVYVKKDGKTFRLWDIYLNPLGDPKWYWDD